MRQIDYVQEMQTTLTDAFEAGLRQHYDPVFARLCRRVIDYRPRAHLDDETLERCVKLDTAPVLKDIVANQVSGATLRALVALLIGSALQDDRAAVVRWATEALTRCQHGDGEWPTTDAEWQVVLNDPDEFSRVARQIKHFLNQI